MLSKKTFIKNIVISLVVSSVAALIADKTGLLAELSAQTLAYLMIAVSIVATTIATIRISAVAGGDVSRDGRESVTVKWFNGTKGYGFITRDSGDDVFVHYRSIRGKGHRSLVEGQSVFFHVSDGDKGLQADDVSVVF
ncbi:MAG: cold-shock protein [Gammaproteobacteria bacterium]|nr:cold-shock protein [Gammaproteobacteria bacterium]